MRDRLIELLKQKSCVYVPCDNECGGCKNVEMYDDSIESIADHLISEGVIVPPCKIGETIWYIDKNYNIQNAEVTCIDLRGTSKHIIATRYIWETEETIKLALMFKQLNVDYWLTKVEAEIALQKRSTEDDS